ncbi:MAG: hypothetical protein ACYS9T_07070 [Planctomycetota bacterium]|jgi:integrase
MLKADLAKAGIPYLDDAGRKADFHCLRHTLATALDQTRASLKERMAIMRHSDKSNLTFRHLYARASAQLEAGHRKSTGLSLAGQ